MGKSEKFSVVFTAEARRELNEFKAFEQRLIIDAIARGLSFEPFVMSRNRKPLPSVVAGFEFDPPLWELRVGDFRVFYDGNAVDRVVTIPAIRRKGPSLTTQEVLQ